MPSGGRSQGRQESRHGRGERRERHDHRRRGSREDLGEAPPRWAESWAARLFGIQLCCCTELSSCRPQERIVEKNPQNERDRDRRERRRSRRSRAADEVCKSPRAAELAAPRAAEGAPAGARGRARGRGRSGGGAEDDGSGGEEDPREPSSGGSSGGSAASRASRASRVSRGSRASRVSRGSRAPRSSGTADGERRRGAVAAADGAAPDAPVKVLNLADLRDQGLSPDSLHQRRPPREGGREEGELSARSGRSEGAKSSKSCRSEGAQSEGGRSEGGRSVASVSIRKYMGYMSEPKSPGEVKKQVKDFVRQMVKGREMGVLRADGALRPVLCGLTRSLDTFRIKSGAETRKVRLAEVERVVHGNAEELGDLATPLDESCSTLELESAECISFKFAERKAAELFTLCMQLFIDGQKQ